jgi:arylsulfatase A
VIDNNYHSSTKRHRLFACVVAALLLVPLTKLLATASPQKPNIVFILADDLSWSDLGCYGHPYHQTPNLDRLAREGMRFTQAYAPAPICSASRAAILTGKTPARLNFEFVTKDKAGGQNLKQPLEAPPYTLDLPLKEKTLAELLNPAGYVTGFYGKWHVSQHHEGYLGWSPTHGPKQQGFAEGSGDFGAHPYQYRLQPELRDQPLPANTYPEDALTDAALAYLQRHRDERFFLYLSHYFVHDPIHSRASWLIEKYRTKLPPDSLPIRVSYGAMVETLDHLVGRVLDELDRLKLTDKTLLVFMSDNGGHPNYTSNAPLRGSKWNLYKGGIRIPFIVRWPGHTKAGSTCDQPVHGCDLFPTFAEVAAAKPGAVDGTSIVPLLKDASQTLPERPLIWHFPYYHPEKGFAKAPAVIGTSDFVTSQTRPHSALRLGQYKLLHFYESGRDELYDLSTDLGEQHDLATSNPTLTARLRERLESTLKASNARFATRSEASK